MASVNPNVSIGVLLPKGAQGLSKCVKAKKKKKQNVNPKPITEHVEEEVSKEVLPSKTRILKRTKKPTKRPHLSPIRTSVTELEVDTTTQP